MGDVTVTDAIDLFMLFCRSSAYKRGTIEFYQTYLKTFGKWCAKEQIETLPQLTHHNLRMLWLQMEEEKREGKRKITVGHLARTVRRLLFFAADDGLVPAGTEARYKEMVKKSNAPGVPPTQVKPVSNKVLTAMLEAARIGRNPRRDTALMLFLYDTGLRISEALSLSTEDVSLETHMVHVRGKGSKDRTVRYGYKVARALILYVTQERQAKPGVEALFTTDEGEKLDRYRARDLMRRAAKRAGLTYQEAHAHPHALRHSYATQYLVNGGNPGVLQASMGHSSWDMTQRYVTFTGVDLATQHEKVSPGDNLTRKKR